MLSALFYLQVQSIKNRTIRRFKRLKQPKYLLGGIVGGIYVYFYFLRYVFGWGSRPGGAALVASPENRLLFESLGALLLFGIALLAWLIPHERAALAFTEAEVAFLFPAPISRRGLIHFKLLRSQLSIFMTTLVLTLVTNRFGGHAWMRVMGWWLALSTLNLHFLGSSFARTRLLDRGITNWKRRAVIGLVVLALGAVVIFWGRQTMPRLTSAELARGSAFKEYLEHFLTSGPAPYLLYPFRLVVRPYLAADLPAFLRVAGPVLLILAAHYWWVIRSDVAFEEASLESSRKLAERVSAARAGNWHGARAKAKPRRSPFRLRPTGPPAVALLWKNLISAGQAFTLRVWLILAITVGGVCIGLGQGSSSDWLTVLLVIAAVLLGWSLLLGPQVLRQDLRQDLPLADLLKAYPLRGWQVALGELLAPAAILTGTQWLVLIIGFGLSSQITERPDWPMRLAITTSAALVFPLLDLMMLQIPNAAVLLFPAWFQSGKDGAHGIEAMGQRLIFMLAQVVVFVLTLLPATGLFLGCFFLLKAICGSALAVALGSCAAAVVLATEVAVGFILLGRWFEQYDLSAEQMA